MKFAVGMPIMDQIPGECFVSHAHTIVEAYEIAGKGNLVLCAPTGLAPHDNARFAITQGALANKCERLFFLDDDTTTPYGGLRMLWDTMNETGAKIVSGAYLRRGHPYTSVWSLQRSEDSKYYQVDADGGVHDIHVSGLGCALIDLKWVEENVPPPWYKMKQGDNYTIISDDVVLYEAVRKAGGRIVGNASVQCSHFGRREMINRTTAQALRLAAMALEAEQRTITLQAELPKVEKEVT